MRKRKEVNVFELAKERIRLLNKWSKYMRGYRLKLFSNKQSTRTISTVDCELNILKNILNDKNSIDYTVDMDSSMDNQNHIQDLIFTNYDDKDSYQSTGYMGTGLDTIIGIISSEINFYILDCIHDTIRFITGCGVAFFAVSVSFIITHDMISNPVSDIHKFLLLFILLNIGLTIHHNINHTKEQINLAVDIVNKTLIKGYNGAHKTNLRFELDCTNKL